MRIAVIGMGYVGCVTATCLARDGHDVIGVDVDSNKVAAIQAGLSPVFEPGLSDLLKLQVHQQRMKASCDIAFAVEHSDVALVAVGTPSANDGSVNYSTAKRVVASIGHCLRDCKKNYTIVMRSTLLPGVLEEILLPTLEESLECKTGDGIYLCNNPEFLRETTAIRDYDQPPFVLVGADSPVASQTVLELYEKIDCEKIVTSTRVAAMVKYSSNAYHALKIAFANEIGVIAKALGANGRQVMEIACKDTQLNVSAAYLKPGYAFGGSCLPKDVRALTRIAELQGQPCEVLRAILPSNQSHMARAIRLIRETGKRRVGLIGLSFKAGTDDLRESPQVLLAETLLGQGFELRIFDPDVRVTALVGSNLHFIDQHLPHLAKLLSDDPQQVISESDLLVLATGVAERIPELRKCGKEMIDLRTDLVQADCN